MPARLPGQKNLWRLLLPLGFATVLSLSGDLTLYAVLPVYAATRGLPMLTVGALLSANRLVRLGSNPLVGLLLGRRRRRGFVLTGLGTGTLSTLLYVLASSDTAFLAARLLWGISWSMISIGGYTMLLDATDEHNRGWGFGILQGFVFAGLAINPLLGGLLSDQLGFSPALLICAALTAAGFLIALFFLPETNPTPGPPPGLWPQSGWSLVSGAGLGWLKAAGKRLRPLAQPRNAVIGYLYFAANFVGDGILASTISLYLYNRYESAVPLGGWTLAVASAGGALLGLRATVSGLVAPLAGLLSDRARDRWRGLGWGALLGGGGLLLIPSLDSPWALLAGVVICACGQSVVLTLTLPLAREINPSHESGLLVGLLAMFADLGMALAPLAAYTLLETISLPRLYQWAGFGLAIGLVLAWGVPKPPAVRVHNPPPVGWRGPAEDG